jgi:AraC-like DNA-binding protein
MRPNADLKRDDAQTGTMPAAIPLIRGFALLPTLGWLADKGDSIENALREVDLSLSPITDPFRPIPLVHAAALLRNAVRRHGPDVPCRIVSETGSLEIAMLGKVALGARAPGEAMARIVAALPYYCSHEQVSFERKPGHYVVREFFAYKFDPETQHTLLQYAAAMIDRILSMAGAPAPRFAKLEIPPHPVHKVEHIRRWFGDRVIATRSRGITVHIEDRIMEGAFSKVARDRLKPRALDGRASLRGGEAFSDSVKAYLRLMIGNDETPSVKRVVAAAGTSARTFQRQLKEEGTNFSDLLAETRQSETLKRLKEDNVTIAAIATDLGYSDHAAFTRAFRRWTGAPPSRFRASTI